MCAFAQDRNVEYSSSFSNRMACVPAVCLAQVATAGSASEVGVSLWGHTFFGHVLAGSWLQTHLRALF